MALSPKVYNDIIEWDIPNWSRVLPFWERWLPPKSDECRILTLGERNGGLSLWLALLGYRVIYTDVHEPSQKALALHRKYGVQERITYEVADVFQMPYAANTFDAIVCKSVIGGLKRIYHDRRTRTLENQRKACEEIRRVLRPGGVFLGAENMKGSLLHRWYRQKRGLNKGWRYLSVDELDYLFSGYSDLRTCFFGFIPSRFAYHSLNEIAAWLNGPLSRMLPDSWQYIAFIAASK